MGGCSSYNYTTALNLRIQDYGNLGIWNPKKSKTKITSNSRPWRSIGSFMYIGSAGPGPGGRTDGRTGGGRTGGRAGGRDDFERKYNDFHRFSQKASKNTVFFCRFASGGSASTDFYSSNEKGVQKMSKIDSVF